MPIEWHLYMQAGETRTVLRFPSWEVLRGRIREFAIKYLPKDEAGAVRLEADQATPEQVWWIAGNNFLIKLRPIKEHPRMNVEAGRTIELKEMEHASRGASGAYGWWNCLGKINYVERLKASGALIPRESIFAREGTAAHKLVQMCMEEGRNAIEYIDRVIALTDDETGEIKQEFRVDDDMATAVQLHLDTCRTYQRDGVTCFIERQFSLADLKPPTAMFGTADFVAINQAASRLTVVDYKHGKGVTVEAQGNPQLKYYALGALLTLPPGTPLPKITETVIVQPRGMGHQVKTAEYPTGEIIAWAAELFHRAELTMDPDAPLTAGDWCDKSFCDARGVCPAYAAAAYAAAQLEFPVDPLPPAEIEERLIRPETLTPEMAGKMRLQFNVLRNWMNAVDDQIIGWIRQGVHVPHWELKIGQGHRKWVDEKEAEAVLVNTGMDLSDLYKQVFLSPAAAEGLVYTALRDMKMPAKTAKPMAANAIKNLTIRPETAPSLVLAGSGRPALPGAQDVFEADLAEPVNQ